MNFLPTEVESLVSMLDKNHGFKRPSSQTVGYSNEEPPAEADGIASSDKKLPTPGSAVYMPSTVIDKTIGLPVPSQTKEGKEIQAKSASVVRPKPKGNDIWSTDEIPTTAGSMMSAIPTDTSSVSAGGQRGASNGGREAPEYTILYKENLGAEDVYLGVDFTKTGCSALCEGLVVKVVMPKTSSVKDITIDVESYMMTLTTPDYLLKASLPIKCVEKKATAKWDAAKRLLSVTLATDLEEKAMRLL